MSVCHRSLWSGRYPSDRTLSGEGLHGTAGLCEQSVSRGHLSVSDVARVSPNNHHRFSVIKCMIMF